MDDKSLVARCLSGDSVAWEELVRAHGPAIRHGIRKASRRCGRTPDPAREEDLVQDTLAFLARPQDSPLARFRWECSLPFFLSVVAMQRALHALRGRQGAWDSRDSGALLDALASDAPAPPEALAASDAHRKVLEALERLPDRERLAVQMFYWDAVPADRIGTVLGVSKNTIWQILFQARERLRGMLKALPNLLF